MSSLRPHSPKETGNAPLAEQPGEPAREMPTWLGVFFGILVAAAILYGVLNWRAKRSRHAAGQTTAGPTPSTMVSLSAAPSGSASRPPRPVEKVVVHPVVHPVSSSSVGKTAERLAVDALHTGDVRRAAELYRELAEAHPDNPALVEAARQLSAKRPR